MSGLAVLARCQTISEKENFNMQGMQKNTMALIGLVVFGVLALGLTAMTMIPRGKKPAASEMMQPAAAATIRTTQFVAQQDIPPRTLITRSMVREIETGHPAEGSFNSFGPMQGRLVSQPLHVGDVITDTALLSPLARVTPANFSIPPGTRAVAIMVDPNSTVGGLVDAGDHVDLVVVHKLSYKTAQGLSGETRSGRTIAQNLLVLATDKSIQKAETPPTPPAGGKSANQGPPPPPPTPAPANAPPPRLRVVLAAPPAEAERIAAAQESGSIHLTLRDPSTIEEYSVPESYEYPVKFVPRPSAPEGGAPARVAERPSRSRDYERVEPIFPRPTAPIPSPALPPMPMPSPPVRQMPVQPVQPAPSGSEITVIRGTEKTRVHVPTG
jgi:pilus assembly protein CpaB